MSSASLEVAAQPKRQATQARTIPHEANGSFRARGSAPSPSGPMRNADAVSEAPILSTRSVVMVPNAGSNGAISDPSSGRCDELPETAAVRGLLEQLLESPAPRVLPLRTDDPPDRDATIRRRLRLEEGPGGRIRLELPGELLTELLRWPLVGVDGRPSRIPRLEGGNACGSHEAALRQLFDAGHVHGTPDAPRAARGEPDRVAHLVAALSHAIDPAEAECLVDRLSPAHGRHAGASAPKADKKLTGGHVVLLEPRTELRRGFEEDRVHRARS